MAYNMHHHRLRRSLLALLTAIAAAASAQVLPYSPTKVLLPPNASYAYVFQASTQGTGQSRLSSLPFNNPVSSAAGWQDNTISGTLPFLRDDALVPYTPVIDARGVLTVFAGDCSGGAAGAEVWYFAVDDGTLFGNGTWTRYNTSTQGLGSTATALAGANFLASGIAFSEVLGGDYNDTNLYVFGGMCPLANSTAETWTSAAEYSNQMLTLAPNGSTDYEMSMVANRGPPIAEAGFSITALSPTYSEAASSGNGLQKQQQDFVLLGGHTQAAFMNMSQVALFSLPQESWTFLPVSQPSSTAATTKSDLSAQQAVATVEVEPRSGHTAVLTEDGESVVLFGGWVGDVSTAAEPQLAVLRLGAGFGGTGDWSWSALAESNSSSSPGEGLYGHGAAMLPGGVMLVVGGYAIPASSSSSSASSKRAVQSANSQIYFYNVSANTWMDTYTPPADLSPGANHSHGALSNVSQKVGLGAGLGIGAAVLIALLIFYLWYTRRLKRARDARGRSLLSRSSDGSLERTEGPMTEESGIEHRAGDVAALGRFWNVWDSGSHAGSQAGDAAQMQESDAAGSTALFVNVPSPTRGLRKGVAGRNYQYHAAPRFDDKRVSRGSANIPTITEHDEEEDWPLSAGGREPQSLTDAERKLRELERVLNSPDPFSDQEPNPLGSHPVSPELAQGDTIRRVSTGLTFTAVQPPRRDSIADRAELPAWAPEPTTTTAHTTTPAAIDAHCPLRQQETGRTSPSKTSERTSSTLSEHSAASSAGPSLTRTTSSRTGTMLSAAAAARTAGNGSPDQQQAYYSSTSSEGGRTATMSTLTGDRKSPFYYPHHQTRARSSTNGSMQNSGGGAGGGGGPNSAGGTDADSFVTARSTNFPLLQSESEALLGSGRRPSADWDDPYRRAAMAARSPTTTTREGKVVRMYEDYPSSNDGRGGGGGGGMIPTIAPPRRRQGWMGSLRRALNAVGERNFSLTGGSVEQYGGAAAAAAEAGERTASSSPTKERGVGIGAAPRRAVSDGGTLLKQKRGQKDWEDGVWPRYRDDPDPGDWGEAVGDGLCGSLEKRRAGGLLEEEEEEEDWDVEGAARKRDVQVMFTVPKARLRVVNADMDRASMRSASEGALSRSGSVRGLEPLHREGSGRLSLRARSEGDRVAGLEEEDEVEGLEAGRGEVEERGWGEKEKAA
ncbi:hypothetical protein LTR91_002093 [Friedmanniomyces endolithicus]|uniref:Galactose oxidase n=1 Tax=Friedmanniomyces endolithicus TaxID=329885 RepID=A0AAN6R120_9PEZI|nr:hypothetical protein LTR57_004039 [Friedmanniomyces endolithicus]KAK1011622.1 hypothetical protein LTR91_002093 [Friedmanniomyces endolithicus]KAK1054932.1 hypothetical protein LTS16_000578 [Friedmanniomyces endolithicus]